MMDEAMMVAGVVVYWRAGGQAGSGQRQQSQQTAAATGLEVEGGG